MFIEYPKHMTRGDEWREVLDAEEEKAARMDGFRFWSDESAPVATPADEKAALRAQLDAKGVDYDARWGVAKLREALEA